MRKALLSCILLCTVMISLGQSGTITKDSIQEIFKVGKIVSLKDNIACYHLNGLHDNGAYGYCVYDSSYTSIFSAECISIYDLQKEEEKQSVLNSYCYTIVAPIFDYALPFSEGWGAVCKDGKWSFVSSSGRLMCDYILDAAYSFKNGKAKVIYKGNTYIIDKDSNGLPDDIDRDTHSISQELQLKTILQLHSECQFEKAIEKGEELHRTSLDSSKELKDITSTSLKYAIQAIDIALSSQNHLTALVVNNPEFYNSYQEIELSRRISSESGHYELNIHNSRFYFYHISQKQPSDSIISRVISLYEEKEYKQAILLYEKWIKENNIAIKESAIELMVYYYLAELSGDYETANYILIAIAELYEKKGFDWLDNDYLKGSILLNIKKWKSARQRLEQAIATSKKENDLLGEVVANYNLAILHALSDNKESCQKCYNQALDIITADKTKEIPVEISNGIISDYIDFLLSNKLWNKKSCSILDSYIHSEIDYNINLFMEKDINYINLLWGRSQARINKVTQHLSSFDNEEYLKSAIKLVLFQQSIIPDAEKAFLNAVKSCKNNEIKPQIAKYMQLKNVFKGFDIWDIGERNNSSKDTAAIISSLEREIKAMLQNEGLLNIENTYINPLSWLKEGEVAIDVFKYKENERTQKYGVFVVKGKDYIKFIPLEKVHNFTINTFWPAILNECKIEENSICYIYAGKLDESKIEYSDIGNGEIAYFKYNIHRVSSLNKAIKKPYAYRFRSISLFGGLEYGEELIAKSRGAIDNGYLEYSKMEVDTISEILNGKMDIKVYSGNEGTADKFLKLSNSAPDIIHLATHGYQKDLNIWGWNSYWDRFDYYGQNTDIENLEHLMNSTGLFFSFDKSESFNLLHSREIASCDFKETKLIVLSACSTLKGENSDSYSSIISLTAAFQMAQVQFIITSLNDVNDEMAYEFMTYFYKQLNTTSNIYKSFRNTVIEMHKRNPQKEECWNSFILLEN